MKGLTGSNQFVPSTCCWRDLFQIGTANRNASL
jgi:hypothetical protein